MKGNDQLSPSKRWQAPREDGEQEARLRFTPAAWARLLFLRDAGDAEVGGFGLSSPEDLLLIEDILLVDQQVSGVTVALDDAAVADLFEDMVEAGRRPAEFGRVWIHTHPGHCPSPSVTDEATFERVFGDCDWSVMFILARSGQTYARLRFGVGPGGEMEIAAKVDYSVPFGCSQHDAWEMEYRAKVHEVPAAPPAPGPVKVDPVFDDWAEELAGLAGYGFPEGGFYGRR